MQGRGIGGAWRILALFQKIEGRATCGSSVIFAAIEEGERDRRGDRARLGKRTFKVVTNCRLAAACYANNRRRSGWRSFTVAAETSQCNFDPCG